MFEPTTLPRARSEFFFRAAAMHDASSGREVPPAIMVRAITASDTPSIFAIELADATKRSPPYTSPASQPITIMAAIHTGLLTLPLFEESFCSTVSVPLCAE